MTLVVVVVFYNKPCIFAFFLKQIIYDIHIKTDALFGGFVCLRVISAHYCNILFIPPNQPSEDSIFSFTNYT